MTTTDVLLGGAIALLVARQLRATFLEHLHADRPPTRRDLAQLAANAASTTALGGVLGSALTDNPPPAGRGARVGWLVSVGARLAFFGWLYDVTDGAAFGPFGFVQDLVGGTVWAPALTVLGLTEAVARLGALAVRARTARTRATDAEPAVPVGPA